MIRVRGQGKYELLSTTSDDDYSSRDQECRVEGILNVRREEEQEEEDDVDDVDETNNSGVGGRLRRSRHRKSSSGENEDDKVALIGAGASENKKDKTKKKKKEEMLELSNKMIQSSERRPYSRSSPSSLQKPDFIEIDIKDGDTLQGLALKFRCPVSEIKRVNNFYSNQEIHSFSKIKVPVKKHGLLKEILDNDEEEKNRRQRLCQKRRRRMNHHHPLPPIDDDDDDDDDNAIEIPDSNAQNSPRFDHDDVDGDIDGDASPTSSSTTCRYGMKELENLFPNRDLSDCESGAETRRASFCGIGGGSDSDSNNAPLVRTFYLSIRENMSSQSSPNHQSNLAKEFLSKMDADLSKIRGESSSSKNSLDEVASTLTSKRIRPLSPPPPSSGTRCRSNAGSAAADDIHGTIFGMNWWSILLLALVIGILFFFTFYSYAKQQQPPHKQHHHHQQQQHHHNFTYGKNDDDDSS